MGWQMETWELSKDQKQPHKILVQLILAEQIMHSRIYCVKIYTSFNHFSIFQYQDNPNTVQVKSKHKIPKN